MLWWSQNAEQALVINTAFFEKGAGTIMNLVMILSAGWIYGDLAAEHVLNSRTI